MPNHAYCSLAVKVWGVISAASHFLRGAMSERVQRAVTQNEFQAWRRMAVLPLRHSDDCGKDLYYRCCCCPSWLDDGHETGKHHPHKEEYWRDQATIWYKVTNTCSALKGAEKTGLAQFGQMLHRAQHRHAMELFDTHSGTSIKAALKVAIPGGGGKGDPDSSQESQTIADAAESGSHHAERACAEDWPKPWGSWAEQPAAQASSASSADPAPPGLELLHRIAHLEEQVVGLKAKVTALEKSNGENFHLVAPSATVEDQSD